MIDLMALLLVSFYAIMGIKKGFLRLFVELVGLSVALTVCYFFYKSGHNPLKTFFLLVVLSIVLPLIARFLLVGFKRKKEQHHSSLSVFSGSILGIAWAVVVIFLFFFIVDIVPRSLPYAEEVHYLIEDSRSYKIYLDNSPLEGNTLLKKIRYAGQLMADKELISVLKDADELKAVFNNKKVQAIANDKELTQAIEKKDIVKILSSPKIIDFLQDGYLMERFMEVDLEDIINERSQ